MADTTITKTRDDMTLDEFLERIDGIMCGISNAERAFLEDLYDEVTKPRWISVDEELPKIGWTMSDIVVVTDGNGGLRLAWYHQDEGWHFATGLTFEPTHWMPLPSTEGIRGNQGKTSPNKGKNDIEIQVMHDPNFDDATRTIYDVMADESYAIATSDEEGGEE